MLRKPVFCFLFLLGAFPFSWGLEAPLATYARYFAASAEPVPDMKAVGSCPLTDTARELYRLLWDRDDFEKSLKPLLEPADAESYASKYLQEQVRVAESGRRKDRLRMVGYYRAHLKKIPKEKTDLKAFYLLRMLSLFDSADAKEAKRTFDALRSILPGKTLPHRLALLAATEKYLQTARLGKTEKRILRENFNRLLVSVGVLLVEVGAFDAARAAVKEALSGFGKKWKDIALFLNDYIDRREKLFKQVDRLRTSWSGTQESAREWALLLLATFRQTEKADAPLRASGNSTLSGLATLLKTRGGLIAAAEVCKELAAQTEEPQATGLKLLALDLYARSSPREDPPQAAELRPTLDGHVDPLSALKLDPDSAHAGVTLQVMSDPAKSFVYVDGTLAAVPGSIVLTPCSVVGVRPGKHRLIVAHLARRDAVKTVEAVHGRIVFAAHRRGRSVILAKAGKNLFLHKKIRVKGTLYGSMTLFDGETRPLSRRAGFATADWPCVFTVLLPRTMSLSALRMKLWDGDKRTYKYMIDISPDKRTWHRVADKSLEGGSSWQNILFPLQRVRVIRIHGLHNSANNTKFHVLELEGYEIASPELMKDPIVWR